VELLNTLTSRPALLAIGVCFIFAGANLRNFARAAQRSLDHRRQHALHHHTLNEANADTALRATWFEKHAAKIANAATLLGITALITAFFR
jgi:hypothetical protein